MKWETTTTTMKKELGQARETCMTAIYKLAISIKYTAITGTLACNLWKEMKSELNLENFYEYYITFLNTNDTHLASLSFHILSAVFNPMLPVKLEL